jgi:hypothetical protein
MLRYWCDYKSITNNPNKEEERVKVLLVENKNLSLYTMILNDKLGVEVSSAVDVCQAEDFFQKNEYDLIFVFEPELRGLSEDEIQQLRQEFGQVRHYWYGGIAFIRRLLKRNSNLADKIIFISYDITFSDNQEQLQKEMPLVMMFNCRDGYFKEIEKRLKK